jgi:orotate phosphoribosyltransferase
LIPAFIVRKEPKTHGTKDQTAAGLANDGEPLLKPGRRVAIVDDVITTGGSVREAMDVVEAMGCEVVLVVAIVERHEHGGQSLMDQGYKFRRLFHTDESGELFIDERLHQPNAALAGGRVLR